MLISLIFTFLFCFFDALDRFGIRSKSDVESVTLKFNQELNINTLTGAQVAAIVKLYNRYLGDSNELKANDTQEVVEQSSQSGELKHVYVDDKVLTLKAVINEGVGLTSKIRVLINVQDINSKKSEIVTFKVQSDVFGYSLVNVQNTQVTLKSITSDQEIILTMYQPAIKNQKGS